MRIIKPGIVPGTAPQTVTCRHCQAVIEFTANEVRRQFDQRDGDYYEFNCPSCTGFVTKAVSSGYNGPG